MDGDKFFEFLFKELVLAFKSFDMAEGTLEDFFPGEAAIQVLVKHDFGEGDKILGLVLVALPEDTHCGVPLLALNSGGDIGILTDGLSETLEELTIDAHTLETDRLLMIGLEGIVVEDGELIIEDGDGNAIAASGRSFTRQFEHFVIVKLLFEVFAVGEEIKEFEVFLFDLKLPQAAIEMGLVFEGESAGAAALDLNEVGGGEDGAHHAEIEDVLAIVAGGHHADGDADAGSGAGVGIEKAGLAFEVVVGEIDGETLGAVDIGGDLDGKVGVVFAGETLHSELVEDVGHFGGVILGDAEHDGFADLAGEGVEKGMIEEGVTDYVVGLFREELALEIPEEIGVFDLLPFFVFKHDGVALLREELGGDLGAGVGDDGVDEETILDPLQETVTVGGLAGFAAESAVGIEELTAFPGARITLAEILRVDVFEIIFGGGCEAELVADEIFKNRAAVAVDRAVGLIGDDEVEVGRGEVIHVLVIDDEGLHRADDDLGVAPIITVFFENHGGVIVAEVFDEVLVGLVLELDAIDKKEDAFGVAGF